MLHKIGTSIDYGLQWPAWIAAGGVVLFVLLCLYAIILARHGRTGGTRLPVPQSPTLRGRIRLTLILVATLPAVSLALLLSESASHTHLNDIAKTLGGQTSNVSRVMDYLIEGSAAALHDAARQLARDEPLESLDINNRLVAQHRDLKLFRKILVADQNGRVIATTLNIDGNPQAFRQTQGLLMEKPYYQQPALNGLPFVSDVLQDPELSTDPTVAISVPISDSEGSPTGVLIGALDLDEFRQLKARLTFDDNIGTIIADRNGNTVFASKPADRMPTDDLSAATLLAAQNLVTNQEFFNFETTHANGSSGRFLATTATATNGWQIFLYRSLNQFEGGLVDQYLVGLAWLMLAMLVALILARALTNAIARPLEELATVDKIYKIDSEPQLPLLPIDTPDEIASVFQHLEQVARRLRRSYGKLRRALQQGEKLRGELIYVVAKREKEIEQHSEELKFATAALERAVREDELTGLANRRSLAEFLDRIWRTAARENAPISILLIDIDHFNAYNDAYGQQCGDNCLKTVADAIRQVVGRGSDLISRYGGEEFVVILGNTSLEGAMQVAENIRSTVEYLAMPHTSSPDSKNVTVSVGVTSTVPGRSARPDAHLVAADRALHKAKETGRNNVAYATGAQTGLYQALCLPNNPAGQPS
jgi:diguanylate cyclase (GGDEF)-like protein